MRPLLVAIVFAASSAHAQFKCVAPDGGTSFQQAPCPADAASSALRSAPIAAPVRRARPDLIVLGMGFAQVYDLVGAPAKINTTTSAAGTSEQLVYRKDIGTFYVYLTNGAVTAIQR